MSAWEYDYGSWIYLDSVSSWARLPQTFTLWTQNSFPQKLSELGFMEETAYNSVVKDLKNQEGHQEGMYNSGVQGSSG